MITVIFDLLKMLEFIIAGIVAGLLGALAGLGGGVVLTPVLTLFLSIPIIYATGSALISTISTSAGSASVYVKKRLANDRIGISLVTATTTGAIIGSLTANFVYAHGLTWVIYVIFGVVLLASIVPTVQRSTCELPPPRNPDRTTKVFKLYGVCYDPALKIWYKYWGVRWWLGWLIMFFAGFISGLLGIGSGALKVLAMDWGMNLPMKVSTTTSNFMIGVTAATSGSLYWYFGYISPFIATCTAIGVLIGSRIGTRMLMYVTNKQVRWVFVAVLAYLGFRMVLRGLGREGLLPITSLERTIIATVLASVIIISLYIIFTHKYKEVQDMSITIYQAQPESPSAVERKFTSIVSNLLKYGVLLSIIFLILGLIMLFLHGGSVGLHVQLKQILDPSSMVNTREITVMYVLDGILRLGGLSLMMFGLMVLIAIPVVMVLLNFVRFLLERDILYTLLALITFVNLMIAIFVLPIFILHG
ncbi:Putative permease [Vulcanisaeta moutnovskia 768-28]|uniref:Probable membrane transporter protein n=1 Tax=Vulcanisaeta moutnovskia (strain 768-28) TaxID=985053 RepID=F0QUN2_VULM7|nr:TSUP family transporter [Vulcanisaeta moutnovskia]ADY00693.1 Putative permease [Vulcanisaeta moutnovskia 768-28]